jgi:hypothetical protein
MLTKTNSATPRTDAVEFYAGDLDGGQEAVPAEFARHLERELHAVTICAGVASKERGEWALERERLIEEAALLCDREADRQSAYEGSVRDPGLKATHAATAYTLIAVAQRIRDLKEPILGNYILDSRGI